MRSKLIFDNYELEINLKNRPQIFLKRKCVKMKFGN